MSKKVIYIAFPGSGKTTLVKRLNKGKCCDNKVAVDLDLPKIKSNTADMLMDAWCLEYLMHGFTVFTHNYRMNYALFEDATLVFAYPLVTVKDQWLSRLRNRGDSDVFVNYVDKYWTEWITGYEANIQRAKQYVNNVVVQYLDADHFLQLLD